MTGTTCHPGACVKNEKEPFASEKFRPILFNQLITASSGILNIEHNFVTTLR